MKKIIFILLLITILLLILFSPSIKYALKKNKTSNIPTSLNNLPHYLQEPEPYINQKIEDGNFIKSSWNMFTFTYPESLKISDGGFDKNFFYLDYEGNPEKNFRIYGITEDWFNEKFNELSRRTGFPKYRLEYEDVKTPGIYISQFTWLLPDETPDRIYRVVYEKGRYVYYLNISATTDFWDKNQDLMKTIINSIKY